MTECICGHPWAMHGPEAGGCVECRCRKLRPLSRGEADLLAHETAKVEKSEAYWKGREEGRAEVIAKVEAALTDCEEYSAPHSCITAGPEVLAVDGCQPCKIRAALLEVTT